MIISKAACNKMTNFTAVRRKSSRLMATQQPLAAPIIPRELNGHAAHPAPVPRPKLKDPSYWGEAFTKIPSNDLSLDRADGPLKNDLKEEVLMYADLTQTTYDNFIGDPETLKGYQGAPDAQDPASKQIGGFKYTTDRVMSRPFGTGLTQINVAEKSPAREYTVGIPGAPGHDPTFYLVATSGIYAGEFAGAIGDTSTNWVGYIALGPPRGLQNKRDIVIAFRGTEAKTEWLTDATLSMVRWEGVGEFGAGRRLNRLFTGIIGGSKEDRAAAHDLDDGSPDWILQQAWVEKGFEEMYRRFAQTPGNTLSMQGQVARAVSILLAKFGGEIESITTCGHSLGGALATMCAFDLVAGGINRVGAEASGDLIPVTAFTFESPRVGNWAFSDYFDPRKNPVGPRLFRVWNLPDVVPKVPYLAWKESGVFGVPYFLFRLVGPYLREIFGPKTGEELPRPGRWPDPRGENWLAFYHQGTAYLVNQGFDPKAPVGPFIGFLRRALGLPLLPGNGDQISQWHNLQCCCHAIDPATRGEDGPLVEATPRKTSTVSAPGSRAVVAAAVEE